MSVAEGDPKYNDLIDVIIQASQNQIEVQDDTGKIVKDLELDPNTLWWKTGSVNANTFGRFAYELEEFARYALLATGAMCVERAQSLANEIAEMVISFKRSVDAKSSESQHNKENARSTLIDKINRKSQERIYTTKSDAAKSSMLSAFLGRDKEKDMDQD